MAEQLEMFTIKEPWKKQAEKWWKMHDFKPEAGMIVLINECPHWGLEGTVLAVNEANEKITVQIRKYPDCPWIKPRVLELNYYKVDPLLRESRTIEPTETAW